MYKILEITRARIRQLIQAAKSPWINPYSAGINFNREKQASDSDN